MRPGAALRSVSPDVVMAAVIGGDGQIEALSGDVLGAEELLQPIGTTLATLASRAVQELGRGGLECVIFEGSLGRVMARELGGGRVPVAVANSGARLGLLLDDVGACADVVARA